MLATRVLLLVLPFALPAGDPEVAKHLRDLGATVAESNGVVTSVDAADCSKWSEDDFRQLGQLSHLRNLSMGAGLNDATLTLLSGLAELDTFQTNLSTVSDDGVQHFLPMKNLRTLKFFHPGKAFTGIGLSRLSELPRLTSLTVAGSLSFGDEGMAAVAKLPQLREFRTWHAGSTLEGAKKLTALTGLKNLTLGQRLAYAPPTSVSDETVAVLAGMTSLESIQLEEARMKPEVLLQLKQLVGLKKLTLVGIEFSEGDVDRLRAELPKVDVKWTAPNEAYLKRIRAMFGAK
ncbi:MAG TPA: hypothetical protein VKW04_12365 [Planctomycetota bacterium]|nr:hypothetical protein [Planctomycetota bacterium]